MRKILGFPVLATGLALAIQVYNPALFKRAAPAPLDIQSFEILPKPAPVVTASVPARGLAVRDDSASEPARSFSPGAKFAAAAQRFVPRKVAAFKPRAEQVVAAAAPRETATVPVVHEVTVSPWRTSVTPAPGFGGQNGTITSPTPQDPGARYELALQIQRELKRVGCYDGRLDGSWGFGSKRALGLFMERVNAALPTTEPDYILLSLITSHGKPVCGVQCPTGQSLTGDGRCVPSAILAQAAKKGPSPIATRQMAWATEVTPAASVTAPQAAATAGAPAAAPVAPLPGRMAVGGPTAPADAATVQGREQLTVALADETAPVLGPDGVPIDPAATGYPATGVPVVAVAPAPAPERAKRNRSRDSDSGSYRGRSTRSVQNLFTHPLGGM